MKNSTFPDKYQIDRQFQPVDDLIIPLLENKVAQVIAAALFLYFLVTRIAPTYGFPLLIFGSVAFLLVIFFTSKVKEGLLLLFFTRLSIDQLWGVRYGGFNPLDLIGGMTFLLFLLTLSYKKVNFAKFKNASIILTFILIQVVSLIFGTIQMFFATGKIDVVLTTKLFIKSLSPFLFYFITALYFLNSKGDVKKFIYAWLAGCVPPTIAMIYAMATGYGFNLISQTMNRFKGFYYETAGPGIVAAIAIFLGMLIYETVKLNRVRRVCLISLIAVNFYTLYLSFARVFVIPVAAGLILWYVLRKKYFLCVIIAIVVLLAMFKTPLGQDRFSIEMQYVRGEVGINSIGTGRPALYKLAIQKYLDYNIVEKLIGRGAGANWAPHNEFLFVLLRNGMLGLIIYIMIFVQIIKSLIRKYQAENDPVLKKFNLVVLILFGALPFQALSGNPLSWINLQWFIWSALGIVLNYDFRINRLNSANNKRLI